MGVLVKQHQYQEKEEEGTMVTGTHVEHMHVPVEFAFYFFPLHSLKPSKTSMMTWLCINVNLKLHWILADMLVSADWLERLKSNPQLKLLTVGTMNDNANTA